MIEAIKSFFSYNANEPLQFNSPIFLVLITVLLVFYPFLVKKIKSRTIYLLAFSLFFFYKTSGVFWLLLLGTSLVNFILGRLIHEKREDAKGYLIISIIWNLGTLSYFKYTNYLISGFNGIFGSEVQLLNIIFPAGISFFTFQTMSYTIDIYRKKLKPVKSFLDFAFFVSFFPQLVAGPIVRASYFLPQIKKKKKITDEDISSSIVLILSGLFKKGIIADFLAVNYIQGVFASPESYSAVANLIAVYAYAMKIYCDFSAYSDIAIGLARLLGFSLPENFNLPYKATSVKDFWDRWHISLSTWLRDYLYIPLGGNRRGNVYLNLMITMLLGGLWHVRPNAFWTYIVWGGLHGLALILHKLWSATKISQAINSGKARFLKPIYTLIAWIVTFNFISLTWVFFRANSVESAMVMLNSILKVSSITELFSWFGEFKYVGIVIVGAYIIHFIPRAFDERITSPLAKLGVVGQALLISSILILFSFVKDKTMHPVIINEENIENVEDSGEEIKYKVQQFEYYKF